MIRPAALRLAGLLLSGATVLVSGAVAHAEPGGSSVDLAEARTRATALRDQLDLLDAKTERAEERLAYTRILLAQAATASSDAEQRLDGLTAGTGAVEQQAAQHVRDVYRMGGALGLYGTVLSADTPADLASRYAAVQAVLGQDADAVTDATTVLARNAVLRDRLDRLAVSRAQLVAQARDLSEELESLHRATARALAKADARVEALAAELAKEQAAAAAASAARDLTDLGITGDEAPGTPYASAAIRAALSVLGSPYVWGTAGPRTFDCSGLIQWSYAHAGLALPRVSRDQYAAATPVPLADLRPGDLLVYAYDTSDPGTIHHITMYIGGGRMVHAPHTGDVVKVEPVYLDGLYGAARPGVRHT